jgi:hypothetical protein
MEEREAIRTANALSKKATEFPRHTHGFRAEPQDTINEKYLDKPHIIV